jgi:hypothetical protein
VGHVGAIPIVTSADTNPAIMCTVRWLRVSLSVTSTDEWSVDGQTSAAGRRCHRPTTVTAACTVGAATASDDQRATAAVAVHDRDLRHGLHQVRLITGDRGIVAVHCDQI